MFKEFVVKIIIKRIQQKITEINKFLYENRVTSFKSFIKRYKPLNNYRIRSENCLSKDILQL